MRCEQGELVPAPASGDHLPELPWMSKPHKEFPSGVGNISLPAKVSREGRNFL